MMKAREVTHQHDPIEANLSPADDRILQRAFAAIGGGDLAFFRAPRPEPIIAARQVKPHHTPNVANAAKCQKRSCEELRKARLN
jgi:hypothetical protein